MIRFLENALAVVGLVALVYGCVVYVLPLESVYAPTVQMPMQQPVICDATMAQGIYYEKLGKPKCYIRGNK